MSRFDVYQVNDTLCLSHCVSLSHTGICSPMHLPTFKSFTHPLILFLTFLLYFSLSLSLVCTSVRACVSLSPSFSHFCPCILSQAFYPSLCIFNTHTLAHTQSHALSHPVTHKRTHASNLYPHLSCTLTHISLSFSLFFSLSLSLLRTHTDTHTHTFALTRSLTYSLAHPLIHCCRVCKLRCLQVAYARALSSLCFSLSSAFSCPFPFRFFSFVLSPPSRSLASSPSSLNCSLPLFLNSW